MDRQSMEGHNSAGRDVQGDKLQAHVRNIRRLQNERRLASSKVSDAFKDAKSEGFNIKALRHVLRMADLRDTDEEAYDNLSYDIDVYLTKMGMA